MDQEIISFVVLQNLLIVYQVAWAPGRAVKESIFKQFWDEDRGVTFVPWDRMKGKSLKDLSYGSVVDPDSVPPGMALEGKYLSTGFTSNIVVDIGSVGKCKLISIST